MHQDTKTHGLHAEMFHRHAANPILTGPGLAVQGAHSLQRWCMSAGR